MNARRTLRALATAQILLGLLAVLMICLFSQAPLSGEGMGAPLFTFGVCIGIASAATGIAIFFRPVAGAAASIVLLLPQSVSFAVGPTAFAFSLWPMLGLEFTVPALEDISMRYQVRLFEPTLWLRTDVDYIGFGIGLNFVAIGVLALFTWAFLSARRASKRTA
jgi:hypothetical protein